METDLEDMSAKESIPLDRQNQYSLPELQMTPECLQQELENCKAKYEEFQKDKSELENARMEAEKATKELKDRACRLTMRIEGDRQENENLELTHQVMLDEAEDETAKLQKMKQDLEAQLQEAAERKRVLEEERKISCRPERRMVFKGHIQDAELPDGITVKPRIQLPISGGCALITFDEAEVAQNIIEMRDHDVPLEECHLRVKAWPVHLLMPSAIEMQMKLCNRRILVSNIPASERTDLLLDKLELFFSKRKNGGGEVEEREFLPDTGNAVLTFLDNGVATELVKTGSFSVLLSNGKTHLLKATSYVDGEIKDLKFRTSTCRRSVLLTGIPDVMDKEPLQDLLEIYFQKASNGGGEVEALSYVPVGSHAVAFFEEDTGSNSSASGGL
uniref:Interferon-induced 35 kDa protein isoform X2 n=1 Tax=Geotrypetes seraphini TaxID=260995 RepID=A0A6P8PGE6_GEOSA|nr:interferon-induced 35 kDa protein isoform X2 [Geotrypetes seraphini]